MKTVYEARAATILYNVIASQDVDRHYLIPANACPAIPFTLTKAGVQFSVLDIERETLSISRTKVLKIISSYNEGKFGLIYIRPYGCEDDPSQFFKGVRDLHSDVLIIDDKCLCITDFSNNITPYAAVVVYSTGSKKMVDMGYGGFGRIKPDVPYLQHVLPLTEGAFEKSVREFQNTYKYSVAESNWLDTSPPEILFECYRKKVEAQLAQVIEHKRRLNSIYDSLIHKQFQLPKKFQQWRYNITVPNKEKILKEIFNAGGFASSHFQPIMKEDSAIVQSNKLHERIINLFNDFYYTEAQAEKTAETIARFLK